MNQILQQLLSKLKNSDQYVSVEDDYLASPHVKTIHENEKVVDLEQYLSQPRKLKEGKTLYQLDSFIKYLEIYKPDLKADESHGRCVVFVSLKENGVSVCSVLDYHKSFDNASFCNHNISLSCNIDNSFKMWLDYDNEWISQNQMINLLKKNNSSLNAEDFNTLLESIERVKTDVKLSSTQIAGESGKSKSVYFTTVETFQFNFKPYFSLPMYYKVKADLYAQLSDRGDIQLKYSIRNMHKIHEQVANDLRIEFGKLDNVLVF